MTAAHDTRARAAAQIGEGDYLTKPFQLDDLLAVVQRFVLPN